MAFAYEDSLTYLPRKPLQDFAKGQIICGPGQPADRLYLVILGRVKITGTSEDGGQTISRIVTSEGLFGESAMIGGNTTNETVTAIDNVTVMSWTRAEIEQQIEREPRLGIALMQYMARQCLELKDRLESIAIYKTPERVMLSLVHLANTLGKPMEDGVVRVASLTHHTLAEFVGTSREIVTFQMNRLRRLGLIRYSRQHIDIYVKSMEDALRERDIHVPIVPMETAKRAGG
jgi:CRP/FNR family transcriptional regulator, cyclic AMP receptor protein